LLYLVNEYDELRVWNWIGSYEVNALQSPCFSEGALLLGLRGCRCLSLNRGGVDAAGWSCRGYDPVDQPFLRLRAMKSGLGAYLWRI